MDSNSIATRSPQRRTLGVRGFLQLMTLALVAVLPAACGEAMVEPPPVRGSISGTVTVEGTGLDGVTVSLSSGRSATTSGGGSYSFTGVAAGSHTVMISNFPAGAEFSQTTGTANITTDGQVAVVDFSGSYIRTATILGSVSVNGTAVGGVSMALSGVESKSAETDSDGNYLFSSLRAGSYTVEITGYDMEMYDFEMTSQMASVAIGESRDVSFDGRLRGQVDFMVRIENVSKVYEFSSSGPFAVPVGDDGPGPLLPGGTYAFDFHAGPGARLSFATMFVQSNDLFYAPNGEGIAVWGPDGAITGDVTDQVMLWDSGTEVNQEPGSGADQPLQGGGTSGDADPDNTVRLATDDFGNLPAVSDVIKVTLHQNSPSPSFMRLTIENVSTATTLMTADGMSHPTPLAPGVYVVHSGPNPLFTEGEPDRGEGLEGLAEAGTIGDLDAAMEARSGLTNLLAPGIYASHAPGSLLFSAGMAASPGLEGMAEDGNPTVLGAEVMAMGGFADAGAFAVPAGGDGPAPLHPGQAYEFEVFATPGDALSFVTMFVQSNDLFYAPAEAGLDLFPDGMPLEGDITDMLMLWDAGTEPNEKPGYGIYQAPRQSGPNMGPTEGGLVNLLDPCYAYPELGDVLRVTVTKIAG